MGRVKSELAWDDIERRKVEESDDMGEVWNLLAREGRNQLEER